MHGHLGRRVVRVPRGATCDIGFGIVLGSRERVQVARLAHEVDYLATIEEILVVEGHQNRVQTREGAALVDREVAGV